MEILGPNSTKHPDYIEHYRNDMSCKDRIAECVFNFEQAIETRLSRFKQLPRIQENYIIPDVFVGPEVHKWVTREVILFPHVLRAQFRDFKLASICASLKVGLALAKTANCVFKHI